MPWTWKKKSSNCTPCRVPQQWNESYFVDDPVRYCCKHIVGHAVPISCHEITGCYCSDSSNLNDKMNTQYNLKANYQCTCSYVRPSPMTPTDFTGSSTTNAYKTNDKRNYCTASDRKFHKYQPVQYFCSAQPCSLPREKLNLLVVKFPTGDNKAIVKYCSWIDFRAPGPVWFRPEPWLLVQGQEMDASKHLLLPDQERFPVSAPAKHKTIVWVEDKLTIHHLVFEKLSQRFDQF